ncbi:vesicle-trafficking protein SEC22b-like, partial [Amphibalanus amphitrite]
MVLMTMIARVADGLPLAASIQEDEQTGRNILDYQNQAKMLFRKLTPQSPTRCSIETGPYLFHYMIDGAVCYLTLCSRDYSKRLAFSYLENIAQEFQAQYSRQVHTVSRPYSFIEF